jgi:thiamine biosynthesis protein ThiS
MKISINGKETETVAGTSVQALMDILSIKLDSAAVELNQEIVTRDKRASTTLKDGDKLEVIRIIGGG